MASPVPTSKTIAGPAPDPSAVAALISTLESVRDRRGLAVDPALVPEESGSIDLVFHVAGSVVKPQYTGMRTGRFSRKEQTLMVQVSVPTEQVANPQPLPFILSSIREAVSISKPLFRKAEIPFPEESFLELADRINREMAASE